MFDVEFFKHIVSENKTTATLTKGEQEFPHIQIKTTESGVSFVGTEEEVVLSMTHSELEQITVEHDSAVLTLKDDFLLILYIVEPVRF